MEQANLSLMGVCARVEEAVERSFQFLIQNVNQPGCYSSPNDNRHAQSIDNIELYMIIQELIFHTLTTKNVVRTEKRI